MKNRFLLASAILVFSLASCSIPESISVSSVSSKTPSSVASSAPSSSSVAPSSSQAPSSADASSSASVSSEAISSSTSSEAPSSSVADASPFLVIGWYAKSSTSGLTEAIMTNFDSALDTYLASSEVNATASQIASVVIKSYDGDVATIGAAINADGNVDILLGVGKNITTKGGVATKERIDDFTCGEAAGRSMARLTDSTIAVTVFAWIQTEAGRATFATPA